MIQRQEKTIMTFWEEEAGLKNRLFKSYMRLGINCDRNISKLLAQHRIASTRIDMINICSMQYIDTYVK